MAQLKLQKQQLNLKVLVSSAKIALHVFPTMKYQQKLTSTRHRIVQIKHPCAQTNVQRRQTSKFSESQIMNHADSLTGS